MQRGATLSAFAFAWLVSHCLAQDSSEKIQKRRNAELVPTSRIARECDSVEDMLAAASKVEFNNEFVREQMWYLAALVSTETYSNSNEPLVGPDPKLLLKYTTFATILELLANGSLHRLPKDESLWAIGPASVRALQKRTGYPPPSAPILRLLERKPNMDGPKHGRWYHMRIIDPEAREATILERADAPIAGFSHEWQLDSEPLSAGHCKAAIWRRLLVSSHRRG